MLSLDVHEQPAFTRYGSLSWVDLLSLRMCGIPTMPVIETILHPQPSLNIRIVLPELIRKYEIERQRGGNSCKGSWPNRSEHFFDQRLDSFGFHVLNVVIIVYHSTFCVGNFYLQPSMRLTPKLHALPSSTPEARRFMRKQQRDLKDC